jgi:hypothetical protein
VKRQAAKNRLDRKENKMNLISFRKSPAQNLALAPRSSVATATNNRPPRPQSAEEKVLKLALKHLL